MHSNLTSLEWIQQKHGLVVQDNALLPTGRILEVILREETDNEVIKKLIDGADVLNPAIFPESSHLVAWKKQNYAQLFFLSVQC